MGVVTLRATRLGEWLRIVVEDDGHGVDTARLRQLAVERGIMTREQADRSLEGELLLILFLPGLTTSTRADLLRGRGLGLDLAEDAVRRLAGIIVELAWCRQGVRVYRWPCGTVAVVRVGSHADAVLLGECIDRLLVTYARHNLLGRAGAGPQLVDVLHDLNWARATAA